ncbi:hypothetical protein BJ508DRAFT_376821 [Ascobolus immersus RN42]|uniref:Guanine nucleotide-exchange factor SEC12 n=1 Tax=Ascobolus immersus RN42 TaxID=1160509 RepID=A0A3N4I4A6_ASCIM|nr:hypothetical protein BJ508DRAFT_376821 [Ascobolus immersus RN42]
MPPQITSEKLTLTYPLFCANFISSKYLLVAGGGGEGRSGVGNKITLLDITDDLKSLTEIELSRSEDAVMSLAAIPLGADSVISSVDTDASEKFQHHRKASIVDDDSTIIFTGINSSESLLASGKNKHFRAFSLLTGANPTISHSRSLQLFSTVEGQHEIYQRLLRLSPSTGLAALATGGASAAKPHSEIVIVDTTSLEKQVTPPSSPESEDIQSINNVRERITPPNSLEVEDLDLHSINDVRERLAFITAKAAYTHEISPVATKSTSQPSEIYALPPSSKPGPKANLRAVRFLTPTILALVENAPARTGSTVILVNTSGRVLAKKKLPKRVPAVTSMDVITINIPKEGGTLQFAIAVAGADMSVNVLIANILGSSASLQSHQSFLNVHPFQITQVAFGPVGSDGKLPLASTSMGNTVVVHKFPLVRAKDDVVYLKVPGGKRQTIISVVISLGLVVVLAVLMQVVFLRRGLEVGKELGKPEVNEVNTLPVMPVGEMKERFEALRKERKTTTSTSTVIVVEVVSAETASTVPAKAEDGEVRTEREEL